MSSPSRFGQEWTSADEAVLQSMVDSGIAIETIARVLERTPNAIASEIKRARRRAQMFADHPW